MTDALTVHRGSFLSLMDKDGWEYVSRKERNPQGAVGIIAITKKKELLLVWQFRASVGMDVLDIPAGLIDAGETAEVAANRELLEETGYVNDRFPLRFLGEWVTSPGLSDEKIAIFSANNCEFVSNEIGVEEEKITLVKVEVNGASHAIKALAKYGNFLVDLKVAYALEFIRQYAGNNLFHNE